jgi:threonine/homoserine/homoserine lactone efflux protein
MDSKIFLQGLALGFSIAAPVGPIGVLCIRRTLAEGRWIGFSSGLGAAAADAFYGSVAAFSLSLIANLLTDQQFWLRLLGGLFLCYLGVRTALAIPADRPAAASGRGLFGAFASTLLLTLSNPMTILAFGVMFAGIAPVGGERWAQALLLVLGVFIGSAAWWLTLSTGVGYLRHRFKRTAMLWVNRISGAIVLGFGLAILASLWVATPG